MLNIGLVSAGGPQWIAGVNYIESLVYAVSLLPRPEQAELVVYTGNREAVAYHHEARRRGAGPRFVDFAMPDEQPSFGRYVRAFVANLLQGSRSPASFRRLLRSDRIDLVFWGSVIGRERLGVKQMCWIPDFQHVHRPDLFSAKERDQRDHTFGWMMEHADCVIVGNQVSYEDALRLYPSRRARIERLSHTMHLSRDWQRGAPDAVRQKYGLPEKFLIFPGQFWKHKNHLTLFRAIRSLRQRGLTDLVLVSTGYQHDYRFPEYAAELHDFLAANDMTSSVRTLGLIPREDQVQLMRAAAALVHPSLFEGWSTVVDEARALGKVIFASDISMHREQAGADIHFFDPGSPAELAELLAAHWSQLTSGSDLQTEKSAWASYELRLLEWGRRFITLSQRVTGLSQAAT